MTDDPRLSVCNPQTASRKWLARGLSTSPNLLFLAVLVIACVVRFWRITQIPNTLGTDEAWFARRGAYVERGIEYLPVATDPRPELGKADSPMQVYLAAAVQMLGLPIPYSSRITSAVAGTITIGLLYPALTAMWEAEHGKRKAQWMALLATAVMAGLFTHIYASRMGTQYAVALMMAVLTLWLTWRALQSLKWGWAPVAGFSLGLSQYCYEAARALPILVGALWVLRIIQAAKHDKKTLAVHLAIMVGFAVLAFTPAAILYIRYPFLYYSYTFFTTRGILEGGLFQVLLNVIKNYGRVLWGISVYGDTMMYRNLAGRPMLDAFTSVFCWLGVFLTIRRVRDSQTSQMFLLWLTIMLLPSAVSGQAPAFSRMLLVVPALAAFVALGMVWAWHMASRLPLRVNPRLIRSGLTMLLAAGLVFSYARSLCDYFVLWVNDPRLFDALNKGPRLLDDRARELARTDQVYLTPASDVFIRPIHELLLEGSPIVSMDGYVCLPLVDRSTRPVDYGVVLSSDHQSLPLLKSIYPSGKEIGVIMHPDGYAYAVIYQVAAGTPGPMPPHPVRTEFAGGPTLIGYDLSATIVHPGESVQLTLYWQGTGPSAEMLTSFVHVSKDGQDDPMVAQHDAAICDGAYPTTRWTAGEIILDGHALTVTEDTPADTYEIAVGLYRASDIVRLGVVQSDHPAQDNRVKIGTLTVTP